MPEVSLKPEVIFHTSTLNITNSLVSSLLVFILLFLAFVYISKRLSVDKPGKAQLAVEGLYEMLGGMFNEITGKTQYGSLLFSFVFSFFIYILFSNWFGLLPTTGTIGIYHSVTSKDHDLVAHDGDYGESPSADIGIMSCLLERDCVLGKNATIVRTPHLVPLFRAPTADLSITLSLALISVLATNFLGIKSLGAGYLKKYFDFSGAMGFFVGLLELISELGKILSFSFRLFGNIFAGEVLLIVLNFIGYGLVTLPFIGLEFFVGIIQALVFYMLTVVFISLAAEKH